MRYYQTIVRVGVTGKHSLEKLKRHLQETVLLDLDEQEGGLRVRAVEIDWETLREVGQDSPYPGGRQ